MIRILVVEDNERVSSVLRKSLESQKYDVVVAADAEVALKEVKRYDFNLAILDIMLPRMNGITLSKLLKEKYPQMPIIMLTALGKIDEKIAGFDAGADDYMVKPFDVRELYARVSVLLKRNQEAIQRDSDLMHYDNLTINVRSKMVWRNRHKIQLTPKEYDLLVFFMKHADNLLTRDEIARNVWGKSFDTGTNYIDVYINYLRKKVDKDFDQKLIHTKSGHGFILSNKF